MGWLRANSMMAAAREIADLQAANIKVGYLLKDKICRKYGIFLDCMTEDEISELERLIKGE